MFQQKKLTLYFSSKKVNDDVYTGAKLRFMRSLTNAMVRFVPNVFALFYHTDVFIY